MDMASPRRRLPPPREFFHLSALKLNEIVLHWVVCCVVRAGGPLEIFFIHSIVMASTTAASKENFHEQVNFYFRGKKFAATTTKTFLFLCMLAFVKGLLTIIFHNTPTKKYSLALLCGLSLRSRRRCCCCSRLNDLEIFISSWKTFAFLLKFILLCGWCVGRKQKKNYWAWKEMMRRKGKKERYSLKGNDLIKGIGWKKNIKERRNKRTELLKRTPEGTFKRKLIKFMLDKALKRIKIIFYVHTNRTIS